MLSDSTIYGGFDLTFIDIDIQPIDSKTSNLIVDLPEIGSHHRDTRIEFRPGGNGFNLCRTLAHLGRKVTYVGPSSDLFESIVHTSNIPIDILPIENAEVNFTAVLNMKEGEIQFNSVKGKLSYEHLNDLILKKYISSPLKSISNISLNSMSTEWVSSLLLSLVDLKLVKESIESSTSLETLQQIDEIHFDGVMFIDPSDISHYSRLRDFVIVLTSLKNFTGEKYLSVNELEIKTIQTALGRSPKEIADFLDIPIIVHTAKEVKFFGKEQLTLPTKNIEFAKTFVGAGDCFNGGFLHAIFDSQSITDSLSYAIETASYLIEMGMYPTSLHISKRINR